MCPTVITAPSPRRTEPPGHAPAKHRASVGEARAGGAERTDKPRAVGGGLDTPFSAAERTRQKARGMQERWQHEQPVGPNTQTWAPHPQPRHPCVQEPWKAQQDRPQSDPPPQVAGRRRGAGCLGRAHGFPGPGRHPASGRTRRQRKTLQVEHLRFAKGGTSPVSAGGWVQRPWEAVPRQSPLVANRGRSTLLSAGGDPTRRTRVTRLMGDHVQGWSRSGRPCPVGGGEEPSDPSACPHTTAGGHRQVALPHLQVTRSGWRSSVAQPLPRMQA